MFTESEKRFLNEHSICRFATITSNGWPHNVPVGYSFDGEYFYVSTEFKTKKLKNVRGNNRVCLVVDEPQKPRRAVIVQGEVTVLERGPEFQSALQQIVRQRGERWGFKEGEQAILRVKPVRKMSWGL